MLNIFCVLFGNDAAGYSSIFSLAGEGLSVSTCLQFLLAVITAVGMRVLFMTDTLIKDMPLWARITALFASVFLSIVAFVILFGWFPVNDPAAWVMFTVCFLVSCTVSVIVSAAAEREENRRLDKALKKAKGEF
ncbi:MAG: hypothetical protein J6F31_05140 [Oscillospiraceae bacterium]|nr:hypothetical protein [Oscillospiraceae bacterium]